MQLVSSAPCSLAVTSVMNYSSDAKEVEWLVASQLASPLVYFTISPGSSPIYRTPYHADGHVHTNSFARIRSHALSGIGCIISIDNRSGNRNYDQSNCSCSHWHAQIKERFEFVLSERLSCSMPDKNVRFH